MPVSGSPCVSWAAWQTPASAAKIPESTYANSSVARTGTAESRAALKLSPKAQRSRPAVRQRRPRKAHGREPEHATDGEIDPAGNDDDRHSARENSADGHFS